MALPAPWAVFRHLASGIIIEIGHHLLISTYRVLISLALALVTAAPIGMLLGSNSKIDRIFAPMIYLLYPIPKIVLLPILLVIVGIGDLSKVLLITLIVFFQILVTTRDAAREINPALVVSMRTLGARRIDIYRHVIVPACLPKILSSLRVSLGTAIAVLFLSETYATNQGIGYYIMDAIARFDYVDVFAGVIAMSLLGFTLYCIVDAIEHRLCRWKYV
jgi:NitT/TauT family transport system permease protein